MATLTGNSVASTYTQLLKITSEGIGADDSAKYIEDGLGTDSALSLSTTRVGIGTASPSNILHLDTSVNGAGFQILNGATVVTRVFREAGNESTIEMFDGGAIRNKFRAGGNSYFNGGNVGIGTANPGQILDVNSGSGNAIADGWDTHSLTIYKENIEDASGYLDKVLACPSQKWNRKPFISADEIKEAVLDEFGEDVLIEEAVEAVEVVGAQEEVAWDVELPTMDNTKDEIKSFMDEYSLSYNSGDTKQDLLDKIPALKQEAIEGVAAVEAKEAVYERQYSVWDELFPEDNSHRQKALYNMPDGDLKNWIDEWCEAKRVEMRPEPRWQKKRLGLVADAELTAEHLPEVISINDEGEPTGIDTMAYIGILHNAIQELSAKVEALENK